MPRALQFQDRNECDFCAVPTPEVSSELIPALSNMWDGFFRRTRRMVQGQCQKSPEIIHRGLVDDGPLDAASLLGTAKRTAPALTLQADTFMKIGLLIVHRPMERPPPAKLVSIMLLGVK